MHHSNQRRASSAAVAILLALLMAGTTLAQSPLPERVKIESPYATVAVAYAEDFEIGDGGFTAGGNATWEHGEPSFHVTPVIGQGPNMWGTVLDGEYENRRCAWVESPAIDLSMYPPGAESGLSTARLLFRHWSQFENRWDGGVVQASADGVEWRVLAPVDGYTDRIISSSVRGCLGVEQFDPVFTGPSGSTPPPGNVWRSDEVDLSAFLGGTLHLRFVMASDSSQTRLGWYVDDLRIEVGAGVRSVAEVPQPPTAEQGVPYTPVATQYAEDFEFDGGGWTTDGTTTWEWGSAVTPPLPPSGSFNMWGTTLSGDYPISECATLTSPPIALPGADPDADIEAARLDMQLWRSTASGYDGAVLQVSTDGGATWERAVPHDGYDRTIFSSTSTEVRECLDVTTSDPVWSGPFSAPKDDEWIPVSVDLTPFMGGEIQLRMVFGSREVDAERRGVYIDDVIVTLGVAGSVDVSNPYERLSFTQPGWTVEGDTSWAFGMPTQGPTSTRPVWATNLHGDYGRSECGAITSPTIDASLVPGLGKLTLTFEHYFDTPHRYDGGVVQVSEDDGATWRVVTPETGYSGSVYSPARTCLDSSTGYSGDATGEAYVQQAVDINSADSSTLRIRFVFASNTYSYDFGWAIRNIGISRGLAAVPTSSGEPSDALPLNAWTAIADVADERLLEVLKVAPWDVQPIVVAGPDGPPVYIEDHASRKDVMSHLAAQAEPFFRAVDEVVALNGGTVTHRHAAGPVVSIVGDAALAATLAGIPGVRAIALDDDESVHLIEPVKSESMGTQNTGGRKMVQAEEIWALGYRGEGTKVTVIDTGVDPTHEAFRFADGTSRIANFTDLVNGLTTPYDDHGHGTHVSGTAGGSAHYDDPTFGVFQEVGVAPATELRAAKFLSAGGSGSLTDAILALQWAYDEGSDVSSNSWGSSSCSGGSSVIATVTDLTDAGMVSVFAAGNSGTGGSRTVGSPACGEAALSVGAIDENMVIAYFSSRGPCRDPYLGTPDRICPDVVAKGVEVRSAIPRSGAAFADPSGYHTWDGTSMATPHVAGAVALIEQMKRDLTGTGWDTSARAEEEVLKLTALDLGEPGPDNAYGWGLVQLLNVHALLDSTDEARVLDTFGVSREELHQGDSTTMSFGVRNLGAAYANGTFQTSLEGPDGVETVLTEREIALGLLDQESFSDVFTVTSNVPHGTYTFRASFDYTWTNQSSGETFTERIERAASFTVNRVYFDVSLDGYPESAPVGAVQTVSLTATNAGNEDATGVTFEFTVPDNYIFVPGANFDPNVPNSRYADPAPATVREDSTFGRVTMTWEDDSVGTGETFGFTTNLLPTELGRQRVLFVAKYHDGADNAFSQGVSGAQDVGLPGL